MEPCINSLLETKISIFENTISKKSYSITIKNVLKMFKSDKYKEEINTARYLLNKGDKDGYKAKKSKLPVVSFSGLFDGGHAKNNLCIYSHVMVLDIDNLDNDNLKLCFSYMKLDEFVFAYWLSPSGNGVKCLVYVEYDDNEISLDVCHKEAFSQISKYFKMRYDIDLDQSGSDYSRLCYVCHDNDLVVKDKVVPYYVKLEFPTEKNEVDSKKSEKRITACDNKGIGLKQNISGRNNMQCRIEMESIIRFLKRKGLSITHSYADWLQVGFAISSTFNIDLGRKFFYQLSMMDTDKFDETKCEQMLNHCYEYSNGTIGFGTIIYKAEQKGYIRGRRRT